MSKNKGSSLRKFLPIYLLNLVKVIFGASAIVGGGALIIAGLMVLNHDGGQLLGFCMCHDGSNNTELALLAAELVAMGLAMIITLEQLTQKKKRRGVVHGR